MRPFVSIDLAHKPGLDETSVCKFRHLLEARGLGKTIFEAVGQHLQVKGLNA